MKKIHQFLRRKILEFIDLFYTPFKKRIPLHTFRYAACGGFNTALDICLFTISYNFIFRKQNLSTPFITLSPPIASLLLAFSISFTTGFYLNRYVVFQQSGLSRRGQLSRYILVNLVCIILNYVFLKILIDYIGFYPTFSKIIATAFVVFFSYFSQTYFFFRIPQKKPSPQPEEGF